MPQIKSSLCFLSVTHLQPEYPLFVFLPGMDGTGQLLRLQTSELEVAFDVRCLAIPPDDLTGWDVLTAKVVALVCQELEQNPHRSVYLCGESFGGCLALKVALAAPRLFDRLVLVNPASSIQHHPLLRWGSGLTDLMPTGLYGVGSLVLLPFLAALDRIASPDRQELARILQTIPPETDRWRLSLLREFDVEDTQLRSLTQPVLLVASARDLLLPSVAEAKRLTDTFPHAQMTILPHSGHACLLEADVNLYEIMQAENFLESSTQPVTSNNFRTYA
jgi:pimeloyl-ACP methyl ester carboxylesterase